MTHTTEQPNIILIMADQLASFVLSRFNPKGQAITPHINALADTGVVFDPKPLANR